MKEMIREMKEKKEENIEEILRKGLIKSAINNNIRGGEYLIKEGAEITKEGEESPLHYAAAFKVIEINAKDIIYQIIS